MAVTGAYRASLLLVAVAALGAFAGARNVPVLGPVTVPDDFPLSVLLAVIAAVALGMLGTYGVDPRLWLASGNRVRLPAARAVWLVLTAALVWPVAVIASAGDSFPPAAFYLDVLLFAGLGFLLVAAGRPDLLWLPAAVWTLAALVFGYAGYGDQWYWWAIPMSPHLSAQRAAASAAVWLVGAVVMIGGPLMARVVRR